MDATHANGGALLRLVAAALLLGCADESYAGLSRDISASGQAPRLTRAGAEGEADADTLAGPRDSGHWRSASEECRPYTRELLEISGYADDFEIEGPDLALTWQPEAAGTYVVELAQIGGRGSSFSVLQGHCDGGPVAPIVGMPGAWPGFSFEADPEQEYTFVVEGEAVVTSIELSIDMGCERVDGASCVREDEDGRPQCGAAYLSGESSDEVSCLPMHSPGEVDERCPATTFRGEEVQGCCRPSGECGHFDAQLGCHDLAQAEWAWSPPLVFYCDERAEPDPPSRFECSHDACARDLDCCADPSLGNASCVEGRCIAAGG